ncbi:MAG: phosphotransferase [Proteobacteria bacterium]|jgi:aminoglycoside/choline kinase family phosphotransferase|nr:phosphotransferase [Pseudomonadota bacterium]
MIDRKKLSQDFLSSTKWAKAKRISISGDASNRSYERLISFEHGNAIFMNSPPKAGEDVISFLKICYYLLDIGLSAPNILNTDIQNGFLILEDFGNNLFSTTISTTPDCELDLYLTAIDTLLFIHKAKPPCDLSDYTVLAMTDASLLSVDWYCKFLGEKPLSLDLKKNIKAVMSESLTNIMGSGRVLVHRDFHAENLLWLKDRAGLKKIGLLDFQDAMLGHPTYDLASLLNDIRRDVSLEVRTKCLRYYSSKVDIDYTNVIEAFTVCSAQRNLRILGVFTRLFIRDKKIAYLALLPRVWDRLLSDLQHPSLSGLANLVHRCFPEPTSSNIKRVINANAD